jgi:hypothetical protein
MLRRIQREVEKKTLKVKLTEKSLSDKAQMAAVVHNIQLELLSMASVPLTDVEAWMDRFIESDPVLDLELASAVLRHDDSFTTKEIPSLNELLEKHAQRSVGSNNVQVMSEQVRIKATELEESTFNLFLQQLDYDVQAFKCSMSRVSNVQVSTFHKKQEWLVQAHQMSEATAKHWWDNNATLLSAEQPGLIAMYKDMVSEVSKRHSVLVDQVVPILILNWTSPCTVNAPLMRLQADVLAEALTHKDSLGLMLMPQFAYRPQELRLQEQMVMQLMTERRINVYRKWALMFKEQVDFRDKRSLAYDGKILVPENMDVKGYLWQQSKVMRGRTELAKQLAAKHMVQVEDFREDALPKSTDMDGKVKGAAKVSQLGEDAMQKVLDAVMEGPDWGTRQGKLVVLLVEINPGVGNLFDAYMTRKSGMRMPVHYLAITDSDLHQEWFVRTKLDMLRQKHFNGELTVPGRPTPSKEMPPDLLEAPPVTPTLNKLVVKNKTDDSITMPQLVVPKELMDMWGTHDNFKDRFHSKLQSIKDDIGDCIVTNEELDSTVMATPTKRPAGDDLLTTPKKARLNPDKIIDQATMVGGDPLYKTPLLSGIGRDLSSGSLIIKPQHRIYIVNTGDQAIELPEGLMVAGFGKGKFKFKEQEPDANPETHIAFELTNCKDKVVIGTTIKTVKDAVIEKRKTEPIPKVCYHTLEEVVGGTVGDFKLTKTHTVLFSLLSQEVGKDASTEQMVNRLGALIPTNFWSSHCLNIFWVCKWTPTGLQPVRPLVCLTCAVLLPPGKALVCN